MRHVTKLAFLGSLAIGLVSCGSDGSSQVDACGQAMAAKCNRAFACNGAAGLAAKGYSSVGQCTAGEQAKNCGAVKCDYGQTYHADQVKSCVDALNNQVCSDLSNEPPACVLVCSGGASAGGGVTGGVGGGPGIIGGGSGIIGGGNGGAGGGTAVGTGTLSAQQACMQAIAALCTRTFACSGQAGLMALGGYSSVAACTTAQQALNCAAPAQGCAEGGTFYADQAKACVDNMNVLSCNNLVANNYPASCDLVCSGSGGGIGGSTYGGGIGGSTGYGGGSGGSTGYGGGSSSGGGIGGSIGGGGGSIGGLSQVDACLQGVAAMCNWAYGCQGASGLANLGYSSLADCLAQGQATCSTDGTCATGEIYHPEQAQPCINAIKIMACSSSITPPSCTLMCTASGSGSGGAMGGTGGASGGGGGFTSSSGGTIVGTGGAVGGSGGVVGGSGGVIGGSGGTIGGTGGTVVGTSTGTGGLSAQQACMQVQSGICARLFACSGQVGLTGMGYASVAACTSGEQAANCATPEQAGCSAGMTYHPDQGKMCVDAVNVWSCADMASNTMPAACDLICT